MATQAQPKMIYAYFSTSELEGLDNLQGGISEDPDTGLREYSALDHIIQIPGVKDLFKNILADLSDDGKLNPQLDKVYKVAKKSSPSFREEPAGKEPYIDKVEQWGQGKDKKLAYIPISFAKFLIDLQGGYKTNPKDGLLEFFGGFLKSIISAPFKAASGLLNKATGGRGNELLRVAGTVGGYMLGGPLGAGAGNALASYGTGKSLGDSAFSGLKNAALTYGAGQAASALGYGSVAPGLAGATSPMAWGAMGAAAPGAATAAATGTPAAAAAAPGMLSSAKEFLTSPLGIGAGIAGLAYMGSKTHQKEQEKQANLAANDIESIREEYGFNEGLEKPKRKKKWVMNPDFHQTDEERERGIIRMPLMKKVYEGDDDYDKYKKGGHVRLPMPQKSRFIQGPGKGQDDKIKTKTPANSYIIDATSVANAGDGSSRQGAKALQELEKAAAQKLAQSTPRHKVARIASELIRKQPKIPVYLSDGEYEMNPAAVTIIGRGSNEEGAKALKHMVKKLRRIKNSNGDRLPPKAPPLINLLKVS